MSAELSEKIRTMRVEKRLTQEDLARVSGVSRRAVSTLENEVYAEGVNLSTLLKVLSALGCKIEIKPACAPTLDDLLREQKDAPESIGTSRVRKTRAELDQNKSDAPCALTFT